MRFKSLDLHGFKSFADKTTLDFHEGVTAIVGPNGCGKSNVVDAIRWVLGETSAKALRGGEMADVIFNGTDSRKASAMAAVTLNLTDCEEALGVEYNEVSITRRVYRDGKSEYRINNTLCRLRDIHDLFLDTGIGRSAYSIMEQGKIDQLLSSKPEDRRAVFEEAAGISKFKKEKKEALRKLEYTSANLLRVSDVMEEQERRIASLKRQVSKARRYRDLSTDVKIFETHIAHQEYRELLAGRNHLQHTLKGLEKEIEKKESSLPQLEKTLTESRMKLAEEEKFVIEFNQILNDSQSSIREAEGQIKLNAERREDLESRIKRNTMEISDNKERLSLQETDLKDTIKQVEQIQSRISTQQSTLSEHKEKVETVRKDRLTLEAQEKEQERLQLAIERKVASLKAKLESYKANSSSTLERADALKADHTTFQKSLATTQASIEGQADKIKLHESGKKSLEQQKEEAEKNVQQLREDLEAAHAARREEQGALSSRTSRLEVLENLLSSGEGLGKGTQSVLSGLNDPKLYKPLLGGTLVNNLSAEDDHITAIEAALGNRLSSILVKDDSVVEGIIKTLTEKSLGKADLLILPFSPAKKKQGNGKLPKSAIGWATDLITVKDHKGLRDVIDFLLADTLIVPDLETLLMLRPTHEGLRMVTLAGELLTPEGFLSGGKTKGESNSALRLQNEIKELKAEIKKREKQEKKAEGKIEELTASRDRAAAQTEKAKTALQEHLITLNTLKSEESGLRRDLLNQQQKLESIAQEQASLSARQKEAAETLSKLDGDLTESQKQREEIEKKLTGIQKKIAEIRKTEVTSFDTLSELQTAVAVERRSYDALLRQQEPLQARILEIKEINDRREKENVTFRENIENSHLKDKELADVIGNSQAGIKQSTLKVEGLKVAVTASREKISETEGTLAKVRGDLLRLTEKRGAEDVEFTKIDLRVENLTSSLRERHQIELSGFSPDRKALTETLAKRVGKTTSPALSSEVQTEETAPRSESVPEERETLPETAEENPDEIDWATVEELARELRHKLDSMGPVNVDAIEEYEELEERHAFVKKQYDDLVASKEELLAVIEKINTETTQLFGETFNAVKENFREMFKQLFGEKGKADLILVDHEDPLESGIEIIAKPPGKKLQSITLLSGGERSMTAVALLFSIYMVKPSPFCVLDELDAPLDESNISRFLNMLEKFIQRSQFIIVTHNKRTMERADILYGVTMYEFGVSKPVGMVLSEAQDIVDQEEKNKNSADSKTDSSKSAASSAAAQISS